MPKKTGLLVIFDMSSYENLREKSLEYDKYVSNPSFKCVLSEYNLFFIILYLLYNLLIVQFNKTFR